MPAYRTRDTPVRPLEVAVGEAPALNIISPTPRAFTFPPIAAHTPSPSPSNSPFEPDLRPLTLSPAIRTHTPSSSISSLLSVDAPATPAKPTHRRRRSTADDITERRPKKGDEDYIKRPENAFILFRRKCCEDRNLALGAGDADEAPTKKQRQADLSKTISQQWKGLSNEERQYWEDLAKEKKREHELLYPHYVYRPQRVKKGKKGKGRAEAEGGDDGDGEGISFVLPVPAVPQRVGRRAASAPTPPLAYQQTIKVPMLYMPSTPTSPSMVPMISRRASSPAPPHAYDYVLPPQPWNPDLPVLNPDVFHAAMFDAASFGDKGVPLDPLSIPPYAQQHLVSPSSYAADSSGPPSPHLETLQFPADAWTQHDGPPLHQDSIDPQAHQLEYQAYAWSQNGWTNGSEPLFNEDFDLSLIPPIALDVPKFDVTPTGAGCPPEFAGDYEREHDPFMQGFSFGEMTTMHVDGY